MERIEYLTWRKGALDTWPDRRDMIRKILGECASRGSRHVTSRIHADDWPPIQGLESSGFVLMDGLTIFLRDLDSPGLEVPLPSGFSVATAASETDLADFRRLAARSFTLGRFHAGGGFPPSLCEDAYTDFSLDTTCGTNENDALAIPRKKEQRLARCGPAEGVFTTSNHGRPKSTSLSAPRPRSLV